MRDTCDHKRMAQALRAALAERKITVGHGAALDIVARQFGLKDWNVLAAKDDKQPRKAAKPGLLEHWWKSGVQSHNYEDGIDPSVTFEGEASLKIKSRFSTPLVDGRLVQCAIMQSHELPERHVPFLGRTVTFSAWIKTLDVAKHATLWMNVEGEGDEIIAASFLEPHGLLQGTQDWTQRAITFHIPKHAQAIRYGLILSGPGTSWFARPRFGEAAKDAVLTENKIRKGPMAAEAGL